MIYIYKLILSRMDSCGAQCKPRYFLEQQRDHPRRVGRCSLNTDFIDVTAHCTASTTGTNSNTNDGGSTSLHIDFTFGP